MSGRQSTSTRAVLLVGTGLIGTSVALALAKRGHSIWLEDTNPTHLHQAQHIGAGKAYTGEPVEMTIVAVPPSHTAPLVAEHLARDADSTVTDTASIKATVLHEVERVLSSPSGVTSSPEPTGLSRYVGGHPLAGRERGGPLRARADLFAGRPWALTPAPHTSPNALEDAGWLVAECGATPVTMSAEEHDRGVAVTSHLPQLVASALAAQLDGQTDALLRLVGQGLRDMTRIADAESAMWAEIATGNAIHVAAAVDELTASLGKVADALRSGPPGADSVRHLIEAGRAGVRRLPDTHGGVARHYDLVPVFVQDQPGQLARLLAHAATAGVNVEDLRVEHAAGSPVGRIELFVASESVHRLRVALANRGWMLPDELSAG